ncbi:uncharacterized protein LOC122882582 isoform X1 [Siniperca chuatsi]|uniref:uncharacterized protein LOC122882582 isoform X1 n=1 Tax=Siniperca chuatsi TaxID=119488 RepID=UPI001CE1D0BD|nr:uncharacterized protein LOC122882582 isoform X1 [Siniperca chuatsi]
MKVGHTFMCFFFLTLRDGNTGLINAEIPVHTGTEGGNITVECSFFLSGSRKIFCKEECEGKDILVETTGDRAQSGRYSIEYKGAAFSSKHMFVSITKLTKSDSGRYRCSLDRFLIPDSSEEFEIRVTDAPITSKPNWTLRPFSTSVPSASTLKTTQSLRSSSGSSTPSSASTLKTTQPPAAATGVLTYLGLILGVMIVVFLAAVLIFCRKRASKPKATAVQLYVRLILVVMIIVSSAAVLIFCRKRASKPKEPPAESEYATVTKLNRVSEEIREEDRQSRAPPVEISTPYTYAKYTKPNGVEPTDDYSLATAASSQKKTEDDSSNLTYSQVDFSNRTAASLHSAPCGDADNTVYSVPRVEASSDGSHAEDASPPLYSTVTLHQL